jgi:hypothetical protein
VGEPQNLRDLLGTLRVDDGIGLVFGVMGLIAGMDEEFGFAGEDAPWAKQGLKLLKICSPHSRSVLNPS